MHAPLPLLSPLIWLRFLVAAGLVVWLPGYLLTGRWLKSVDGLSRFVLSVSMGLALPFVYNALAGRWGAPFTPYWYLAFILPLTFFLGLLPMHASAQMALVEGLSRLPQGRHGRFGWVGWAVGIAALLILLKVLIGYGALPVPPHVHDASNHAWITQRVVQTESLSWTELNQDAAGGLGLGYLPGIHAAAALTSRVGGLAPYAALWLLVVSMVALTPIAWTLLWRAWGVSLPVVAIAALLSTANSLGPGGVMNWGGFGQLAGFFLVPVGVLALRAAWAGPRSWQSTLWRGANAGIILGTIAYIHASEVVVAVGGVLVVAAIGVRSSVLPAGSLELSRHAHAGMVLVTILGGFAAVCGVELWTLAAAYPGSIASYSLETQSLVDSLRRVWRSGGNGIAFEILVPIGWVLGLRNRPLRPLMVTSLLLGAFYVSLRAFADPITRVLSMPFYQQAPRILYLQLYLYPIISAIVLWRGRELLHRWFESRRPDASVGAASRSSGIALAVVLVAVLGLAWNSNVVNLRNGGKAVPFTVEDYHQASSIADVVPRGAMVANFWDDGSTWAMHVSGRPFLLPEAWDLRTAEGRSVRELALGLREDPWPDDSRQLLDQLGIDYLYVSDGVWGSEQKVRREEFDRDSRFDPILVGESSTLYRIHAP